jgi:hypothetical protein
MGLVLCHQVLVVQAVDEQLRSGPLSPVLSTLFQEGSSVEMRVRVADLASSNPELYSYMWAAESDGAFFRYAMWAIRGSVWIVIPSRLLTPVPLPVSQVSTVELMDTKRSNLPRIRPRHLVALPAVARALEDGRIREALTAS